MKKLYRYPDKGYIGGFVMDSESIQILTPLFGG